MRQTETIAAMTDTNDCSITEKEAISNLHHDYFTNVVGSSIIGVPVEQAGSRLPLKFLKFGQKHNFSGSDGKSLAKSEIFGQRQ